MIINNKYRSEIDGLRAIAVVAVIIFHINPSLMPGGFLGVDIFFVLSGYLIHQNITRYDSFNFFDFYIKRFKRIAPLLLTVLLVTSFFSYFILLPDQSVSYSKSLISNLFFSSNIYFWSERGYFDSSALLKPLIHTWSLSVEEHFYLIYPFIFYLIFKNKSNKNTALILIFFIIVELIVNFYINRIHPDSSFFLTPFRFWEFLIGVLISYYLICDKFTRLNLIYINESICLISLLLILYAFFNFSNDSNIIIWQFYICVSTSLLLSLSTTSGFVYKILSTKLFVYTGLLSYALYLWHQPVISLYSNFLNINNFNNLNVLYIISLIFTLSFISYFFIEKPFRYKYGIRYVSLFSLSIIIIVIIFVVHSIQTSGFLYRYSSFDINLLNSTVDSKIYVPKKFDSYKLSIFSNSNKKKILIIGDSFAQDLVNILDELGVTERFEISTYGINSECGNLYLNYDFTNNIEAIYRSKCKIKGWYSNQILIKNISNADYIFLSSSWESWVIKLLPDSLINLKKMSNAKIFVFGSKNFGNIDIKNLLAIPHLNRRDFLNFISSKHIENNETLRSVIPDENFINLSDLICNSSITCKIFTDDYYLISYDGYHLSKFGAKYVADKIHNEKKLHFLF